MYIPSVFYKRDGFKDQASDLFSRLLNSGCIFITGAIDDNTATMFLAASHHIVFDLQFTNITVYINSPGGDLYSGLAIVDIMRFGYDPKIKFETRCVGLAASAASIILSAGHHRIMSANSRVMIHQPLGGIKGQATDIQIYADQISNAKKIIINLYTKFSKKKSAEFFQNAIERDTFLNFQQAFDHGLVDDKFGDAFDNIDDNKDIKV